MLNARGASMRVLHLFSNSKWTGPAEPALRLCLALRDRGLCVAFACAPTAGSGFNKVVATARAHGIEPLAFMHLQKHAHPVKNWLDARALRRYLREHSFDLLHCHLDNDHAIALRAAKPLGIPVVRSNYEGEGFPGDIRHQRLLRHTLGIVEPSRKALESDMARFGISRDRLCVVPGAVDTCRFDPDRALPDMRARLGISSEAFVLGIVARMQPHRRYEDLFVAFARFAAEVPGAHLLVIGRGSRQEQVGFRPAERLHLAGRVHFPGYLDEDTYVGALHAFDAGVFLTPGSDGTCRAAREIMAMGKPVVAADRGMLSEIVTHGADGAVVTGSPESLHEAFLALYHDRGKRAVWARQARITALERYALPEQARAVHTFYETLLRLSLPG